MGEPYWEGFLPTGDAPAPGFYLHVGLHGFSEAQTKRLIEQADEALSRYRNSERAVLINTFESIREAAERRFVSQTPNSWLIRVAIHPTDPISQVEDDCGHAIAFALRFAEDPVAQIAEMWRGVASGFTYRFFPGVEKEPPKDLG